MTKTKTRKPAKPLPKGAVLSDAFKAILVRRGNPVPVTLVRKADPMMDRYALVRVEDGKPVGPCGLPFGDPAHATDWAKRMGYDVVAA